MRQPVLLLLATLLALPMFANPIAINPSRNLEAPEADVDGEETVEMLSEDVRLTLSKPQTPIVRRYGFNREVAAAILDVKGTYHFKNHGETQTLDVGFPCRGKVEADNMYMTVDGVELKSKPINPETDDTDIIEDSEFDYMDMKWEVEFKAAKICVMEVAYKVILFGGRETGYVVRSGYGWKDAIGVAKISLTMGEGFSIDNLRKVEPASTRTLKDGVFHWVMKEEEPDGSDDILVRFSTKPWSTIIGNLKEQAKSAWFKRIELAKALAEPPLMDPYKISEFTAEQQDELLSAIEQLLPRTKQEDKSLTIYDDLPPPEPGSERELEGDNIENALDDGTKLAIKVHLALRTDRSKKLLEGFLKILNAGYDEVLWFECDGKRTNESLRHYDSSRLRSKAERALQEAADE